jgi:hypothetical protein
MPPCPAAAQPPLTTFHLLRKREKRATKEDKINQRENKKTKKSQQPNQKTTATTLFNKSQSEDKRN